MSFLSMLRSSSFSEAFIKSLTTVLGGLVSLFTCLCLFTLLLLLLLLISLKLLTITVLSGDSAAAPSGGILSPTSTSSREGRARLCCYSAFLAPRLTLFSIEFTE